MSSTTTKVLTGCGIGCLLIGVLVVGMSWMSYRWAKGTVEKVEATSQVERELLSRFGGVRDFVPPLTIVPDHDRLESFLMVRDRLAEPRDHVAETVEGLVPSAGGGGMIDNLRAARAGVAIAPLMLELAAVRDQALLESAMGLGEYTWIYWLGYVAFLGNPPGESALHQVMAERRAAGGSMHMDFGGDLDPQQLAWRMRRDVLAMLENARENPESIAVADGLREAIDTEIAVVRADSTYVPWQNGLPDEVAAQLEPYRARFEATYSPAANIFELAVLD